MYALSLVKYFLQHLYFITCDNVCKICVKSKPPDNSLKFSSFLLKTTYLRLGIATLLLPRCSLK